MKQRLAMQTQFLEANSRRISELEEALKQGATEVPVAAITNVAATPQGIDEALKDQEDNDEEVHIAVVLALAFVQVPLDTEARHYPLVCVQSLELQLCRAHLQFSPKEHVTLPTPTVIALDAILSCKTHVGRLDAVHRVSEIFSACSKIACTDLNGSCFWLTSSSQLLVEVQRELPGLPLDVDRSGLLSRIPDDDDDDMATLASFLQEMLVETFSYFVGSVVQEIKGIIIPAIFEQERMELSSAALVPKTTQLIDYRRSLHTPLKPVAKDLTLPSIFSTFECVMDTCRQYAVPFSIVNQAFQQFTYFIAAHAFNHILENRQLCTFSTGLKLKMVITTIDTFLQEHQETFGQVSQHLDLLRQCGNFLMVLTNAEVFRPTQQLDELFSRLSPAQMLQLLEGYEPDHMAPGRVPDTVRLRIELNVIEMPTRLALAPPLLDANALIRMDRPSTASSSSSASS